LWTPTTEYANGYSTRQRVISLKEFEEYVNVTFILILVAVLLYVSSKIN
jgi:hypothetical protein